MLSNVLRAIWKLLESYLAIGRNCCAGGTDNIIGRIPEFNEDAVDGRVKTDTAIEGDKNRHCAVLSCSHSLQNMISDDYTCGWIGLTN